MTILLMSVIWSSAFAQTEFGNNSTTTNTQYTSATEAWAIDGASWVYTAPSDGTVTEVGAYLKSYSGGTYTADIGIYTVVSGVATTLLGEAQVSGSGGTATMRTATGLSISVSSGDVICIAVGNLTNGARLHAQTGGTTGDLSRQTSSPDLLATWDEQSTQANYLCAYGVFEAGGGGGSDPSPRRRKVLLQGDK